MIETGQLLEWKGYSLRIEGFTPNGDGIILKEVEEPLSLGDLLSLEGFEFQLSLIQPDGNTFLFHLKDRQANEINFLKAIGRIPVEEEVNKE